MANQELTYKFVKETDVQEARIRRQEEWDRVRKPEDPEEAPEEQDDPDDNRPLWQKLKDQRDRKQEDFEEQHKFKNQIRGLDDEEAKFLDTVDAVQRATEISKIREEKQLLDEYRNSVEELVTVKDNVREVKLNRSPIKQVKSQSALLKGAIKRKCTGVDIEKQPSKVAVLTAGSQGKVGPGSEATSETDTTLTAGTAVTTSHPNSQPTLSIFPSLLNFASDSSDSEESSGDSVTDVPPLPNSTCQNKTSLLSFIHKVDKAMDC